MTDLPYRAMWRRELNARAYGQNPDLTATWKLDHLWLASVLQHKAEESEIMLQEALDANDHPDTIAHFLAQYEDDCAECHRVFLAGEEANDAAA